MVLLNVAERTSRPGATTSGFTLPVSADGPRLLKPAMALPLSVAPMENDWSSMAGASTTLRHALPSFPVDAITITPASRSTCVTVTNAVGTSHPISPKPGSQPHELLVMSAPLPGSGLLPFTSVGASAN